MFACVSVFISRFVARFCDDKAGTITATFALTMIPVMTAVGAAVDYSRANSIKSSMQAALDAAVLAGAKDGSSNWTQVAANVFNANIAARYGLTFSAAFSGQQSAYSGSAQVSVPTVFMSMMHISAMQVAVTSAAQATAPDNSCILTLDKGQPTSHISLTLNGAPIINLSGCSIRSNTALECNGHDGNVTKSIAGGLADGCGHPNSYAPIVPDIYAALASNITKLCGSSRPGVSWTPGILPTGAGFIRATNNGRTEYHVCGDLSLSGTGSLTGSSPGADTLIVIENGSLNIANNAAISVTRMGIVLTGDNSVPSAVNFPTGNGQSAQLTLSPPIDPTNPWQGVSLYQDPSLTNGVNNKWGPGANFNADGLVYLSNSNVVTDGNTSSSNAQCSKFVMNTFTTNGRVDLNFDQSVASCAAIGLKQWSGITVHLVN